MDQVLLSLLTGLGLGLASTLHCAGMCGAIAGGLLQFGRPESARDAVRLAALTHAGRISAYIAAGCLIGAIGAPAVDWLDREVAFRLLQWAGAAALMWIGLSLAGLLPPLSVLDRALAPLAAVVARAGPALPGRNGAAFAGGLIWGLMPCAMVYAALFTALLTGSARDGAAVMAAFGVGTLPALLTATAGLRTLASAAARPRLRRAAGLAIGAMGMASVWMPHPASTVVCEPDTTAALTQINGTR